jgi:hypothetical protein
LYPLRPGYMPRSSQPWQYHLLSTLFSDSCNLKMCSQRRNYKYVHKDTLRNWKFAVMKADKIMVTLSRIIAAVLGMLYCSSVIVNQIQSYFNQSAPVVLWYLPFTSRKR